MFEIGVECLEVLVQLDELLARAPVGTVVQIVSNDLITDVEMIRWSDQTWNELLETRLNDDFCHFI